MEALGAGGSLGRKFRAALEGRERMLVPTLVLFEWLKGPRVAAELELQEELLLIFGPEEALKAAELYRAVPHPRGREIDLAIAACAICADARLWTINVHDFRDIPGLHLFTG